MTATEPPTQNKLALAPLTPEEEKDVLNKAQMYDLYKMDRDARKATGYGFFPQQYADILERYFTIGEIDVDKAESVLKEFFRAKMDDI